MEENTLRDLQSRVSAFMQKEGNGHGFDHVKRVCHTALQIAKTESADTDVVVAAALLHDVGDYKLNAETKEMHREMIVKLAGDLFTNHFLEKIIFIAERVSYKGAKVKDDDMPIEGKIVRDADRLDAIGAIGIARAFAYGGSKNRPLFIPDEEPDLHTNFEEYKSAHSSSLNHFYEKLFLLKDLMETTAAKKIAINRHAFMEEFVERFKTEWFGLDEIVL